MVCFRDYIRYLREYDQIKKLKKASRLGQLVTCNYHYGETFLAARYRGFDGKVLVSTDKRQLELVRQFPMVAGTVQITERCYKLVRSGVIKLKNIDVYAGISDSDRQFYNYDEIIRKNLDFSDKTIEEMKQSGYSTKKIRQIFSQCELDSSKPTILILPDVRTLKDDQFSTEFWCKAANIINGAGCNVLFNTGNTIGSYVHIFPELIQMPYLGRRVQGVIGVRSGLSDILAGTTETPLLQIYPEKVDLAFYRLKEIIDKQRENETDAEYQMQIYSLKSIRQSGIEEFVFDGIENALERVHDFVSHVKRIWEEEEHDC